MFRVFFEVLHQCVDSQTLEKNMFDTCRRHVRTIAQRFALII